MKKGEVNKGFQKRWFVLKGNLLFYFEKRHDKEPLGVIILEGCTIGSYQSLSDLKTDYRDGNPILISFIAFDRVGRSRCSVQFQNSISWNGKQKLRFVRRKSRGYGAVDEEFGLRQLRLHEIDGYRFAETVER